MQYTFKQLHLSDVKRNNGSYSHKLLKYLRRCQTTTNKLLLIYYRWRFMLVKNKRGIEIYGLSNIGPGLYLGHCYNITINSDAIIGKNCNIHKGVTIGQENRGKRKGSPTLGDCVWIGINSTIVGKINIGNDVLIAPNSYVNCDVPSHSIVFGNPCQIRPCKNATEGYINNKCSL